MAEKLRVLHVVIQPVLVWDDGEELISFEQQISPLQVPLSGLNGLDDRLKDEVKRIEEQLQGEQG